MGKEETPVDQSICKSEGKIDSLGMGIVQYMSLFINDKDTKIQCTLGKLASDTKSAAAVVTKEGRDAIQTRDKLDKWANVNQMRLNKSKCKHLVGTVPDMSPDWENN